MDKQSSSTAKSAIDYGYSRTLDMPYAQAVERAREALKTEGFGVLCEIDIKEKLKEKLDVDFRNYVILGACNPPLAYQTLQEEINELDAVTITAGSFTAGDASRRTVFRPLDIATTAGATADIAGALNTLPGTQKVGETGRLFVRGGDGSETRTFIDGLVVLDDGDADAHGVVLGKSAAGRRPGPAGFAPSRIVMASRAPCPAAGGVNAQVPSISETRWAMLARPCPGITRSS